MLNKIRGLYFSSLTYHIYSIIEKKILHHPIYRFFTDFSYISELWHESLACNTLSSRIDGIICRIYDTGFSPSPHLCIYFLFPVLILPSQICTNAADILIISVILLFTMRYAPSKQVCRDFFVFIAFMSGFLTCIYFVLPLTAFDAVLYLSAALAVYYALISSISAVSGLYELMQGIFLLVSTLCTLNLLCKNFGVGFTEKDSRIIADIIILLTPPSLCFTLGIKSALRRFLYTILTLFLTFSVLVLSSFRAGFIGYCTAIVLFIAFTDFKYLLPAFLLAPTIILSALDSFLRAWTVSPENGGVVEGIVYTAINFWNNGIGLGAEPFLKYYGQAASTGSENFNITSPFAQKQIEVYGGILLKTGFAALLIILWYSLRLIRNAVFGLFSGSQSLKRPLWAGLCSLTGIAVSVFLSYTSVHIKIIISYCIVLSILSVCTKLDGTLH